MGMGQERARGGGRVRRVRARARARVRPRRASRGRQLLFVGSIAWDRTRAHTESAELCGFAFASKHRASNTVSSLCGAARGGLGRGMGGARQGDGPRRRCRSPARRAAGLRYSSHTARSGLGLARVVRLFAWPRHASGMLSTTPLDPCACESSAQGGNTRRTGRPHPRLDQRRCGLHVGDGAVDLLPRAHAVHLQTTTL